MTKPDDIPESIWDQANDMAAEWLMPGGDGHNRATNDIARAIMAATRAEREACAALVEQNDLWFSFEPTVSSVGYGGVAKGATPIIAAAIRKRGEA